MEPKYHALVIGNSEYHHADEFPTIQYARNDAERIFKLLTASDSSIFSPETSILKSNITYDEIDDILDVFFAPIQSYDLVLIYFAGHAKAFPRNKRLFLAMKNTNHTRLARTAFSVDKFLDFLLEKNIGRYIVTLDCCRAGTALDSPGVQHRGEINSSNLQNLSGQGKIFIASSLRYQLANELEKLQHGLFSHYFIHGIETGEAVASSKEYINITDLFVYIHQKMKSDHSELGQEPVMDGTDVVGELHVALNKGYQVSGSYLSSLEDYIKCSLGIEDLSDEGTLRRARLHKLHSYLSELHNVDTIDISSQRKLALLYGEAIGLTKKQTDTEFDRFVAALRFANTPISDIQLHQLNSRGNAFLFSTGYKYHAYESEELQASLFSYYLSEALSGLASNTQGLVTLSDVFNYVDMYVPNYDRFQQKPILIAKNMKGDPVLTAAGVNWTEFKGKRFAILVGVDEYQDRALMNLRYATSDARKLTEILSDKGGFETTILVNATQKDVLMNFERSLKQLGTDDFLIFYFSGHGFSAEDDGFAALNDTMISRNSFMNALCLSEVSKLIYSSKVGTTLVILDACMSPARPAEVLHAIQKAD